MQKLEVDSSGKVLRTLGEQRPRQGDDVQLTIDLDVQRLAEESLEQGLELARTTYDRSTKKNSRLPGSARHDTSSISHDALNWGPERRIVSYSIRYP